MTTTFDAHPNCGAPINHSEHAFLVVMNGGVPVLITCRGRLPQREVAEDGT
jgi:hypothetical protein